MNPLEPAESSEPVEVRPDDEPGLDFDSYCPPGATLKDWRHELSRALAKLRTPPAESKMSGPLLLLLSVLAFVLVSRGTAWTTLFMIVGILFVHECGHLIAMRAFGYRDTKMFFIPFFGAAVIGRKEDATYTQKAIVALAGPLPGIFLSSVVLVLLLQGKIPAPPEIVFSTIAWAIFLNAFNLLPIFPLDGGHFFHALIFSRNVWMETLCKGGAALAFCAAGFFMDSWVFGAIGLLALITLRLGHQTTVLSTKLRAQALSTKPALHTLPDALLLRCYLLARETSGKTGISTETAQNLTISMLQRGYPASLSKHASLVATLILLMLYGFALVVSATGGLYALDTPSGLLWQYGPAEKAFKEEKPEQAIRLSLSAIEKRPTNYAAHSALCYYYYRSGMPDEAKDSARRAIKLQPRDPRPYLVLGYIAVADGDMKTAKANLEALRKTATFRGTRESIKILEDLEREPLQLPPVTP